MVRESVCHHSWGDQRCTQALQDLCNAPKPHTTMAPPETHIARRTRSRNKSKRNSMRSKKASTVWLAHDRPSSPRFWRGPGAARGPSPKLCRNYMSRCLDCHVIAKNHAPNLSTQNIARLLSVESLGFFLFLPHGSLLCRELSGSRRWRGTIRTAGSRLRFRPT